MVGIDPAPRLRPSGTITIEAGTPFRGHAECYQGTHTFFSVSLLHGLASPPPKYNAGMVRGNRHFGFSCSGLSLGLLGCFVCCGASVSEPESAWGQDGAANDRVTTVPDDRSVEVALEFFGFRSLVASSDLSEVERLTRDDIEAMSAKSGVHGYLFDGVMWGRIDKTGASTFAGQYSDKLASKAAREFVWYHREEPSKNTFFPASSTVFGRTRSFMWRGDAVRGVFVQTDSARPDLGFEAGIAMFDRLFTCSIRPEAVFEERYANGDASVVRVGAVTPDGKREVRLKADDSAGVTSAVLVVMRESENEHPLSWSLLERVNDGAILVWRVELRHVVTDALTLPESPSDLSQVHRQVTGMDQPFLSDLNGKAIAADMRRIDDHVTGAESRRRLFMLGAAVLLFYFFLVCSSNHKQLISVVGLEIAIGVACLTGLYSRTLVSIVLATLFAFTIALVLLDARDTQTTCGCFGGELAPFGGSSLAMSLLRNGLLGFLVVMSVIAPCVTRTRCHKSGRAETPTLLLIVSAIIVSAWPLPAIAQYGSNMAAAPWHEYLETPLASSITPMRFDRLMGRLNLTPDQAAIARHFHAEHLARFAAFREKHESALDLASYRAALETLPSGGGAQARVDALVPLAEREAKLAPIADEQTKLDDQFLEEIRSILSPEQQTRWNEAMQWLNRERWERYTLPRLYPGDHITLFAVLERLDLAPTDLVVEPEVLEELLTKYAAELDEMIISQYNTKVKASRGLIRSMLRQERANQPLYVFDGTGNHINTTTADPEFRLDVIRSKKMSRETGRRFHTMQERYRASVLQLLTPEKATAFRETLFELTINRPPPRAKAYIESLLAIDGLDEDRRVALDIILSDCLQRTKELWVEEHETRVLLTEAQLSVPDDVIVVADDPRMLKQLSLRDLLEAIDNARLTLDDDAMRRAFGLFTPDEQADLPKPPYWRKPR